MYRINDKIPGARSAAKSTSTWNRVLRCAPIPSAALGVLAITSSAHAARGNLAGLKQTPAIKLPMLAEGGRAIDDGLAPETSSASIDSIVGLWHVVYTAGGETFNESLDEWHRDGTEFENAYLSPAVGNICFGVWKQVGPTTVHLHHIGWMFNSDSSLAGTFTVDQTNELVHSGNGYEGNFDFKVYDVDGKFIGTEVKGTIVATRIKVD